MELTPYKEERPSFKRERNFKKEKGCCVQFNVLLLYVMTMVSLCTLVIVVLAVVGTVKVDACKCCSEVKAQSELQRRVQEIDNMDKNVSHLTKMMKIQKTDVQRIWILLNMTMEKLQKNNEQRPTTTSEVVTPTNTPLVNPKDSEFSRLRALYNETLNELNQLKLKVDNITLTPGPTGPQGQEGLIGSRGPPGNPGRTGPSGPTGPRGLNGTRGLPGPQGQQGLTGPQGLTGLQGAPGAHGNNGSSGPTGPRGNDGSTGPQGNPGRVGQSGPTGLNGTRGLPGPQGQQGLTGPQGLNGLQGPPGTHGNNGSSGATGPRGNAGTTGPQGLQGVKGPPGLQGPPGLPGSRGAGNFSLCVYKRKDSTGVGSGPTAATQVFLTEPTITRKELW